MVLAPFGAGYPGWNSVSAAPPHWLGGGSARIELSRDQKFTSKCMGLGQARIKAWASLPNKGHGSDGAIYQIWGRWRDGPEKRARGDLAAWKMLIGSF